MPRTLTSDDVDAFKQRIIDAAELQFAEHGPEAVTIRQLATAVGVSAMTPYRYFADKDAILAAVRARAFDRHAQALETAFELARGGDEAAESGAVAEAYIRFAEEHPAAYKLMFDVNQPSAGEYPDLVRAGERSRQTMTAYLEKAVADGRLKGEAAFIGHLYWSAIHGPLMLQLSGMLTGGIRARDLIVPMLAALDREVWGKKAGMAS